MADEEALHKIFSNLFSNAVKYSEEKVLIRLQNQSDRIRVEVSNDGPLIPRDMHEKIFEPFYRLKGNGKQKGTGLGLALARSLTELLKGKLFVEDNQSGLNTFIFTLTIHQN
jgi:signal transduction histidine kinase